MYFIITCHPPAAPRGGHYRHGGSVTALGCSQMSGRGRTGAQEDLTPRQRLVTAQLSNRNGKVRRGMSSWYFFHLSSLTREPLAASLLEPGRMCDPTRGSVSLYESQETIEFHVYQPGSAGLYCGGFPWSTKNLLYLRKHEEPLLIFENRVM